MSNTVDEFFEQAYTNIDGITLDKNIFERCIDIIGDNINKHLVVHFNDITDSRVELEVGDQNYLIETEDTCLDDIIFKLINGDFSDASSILANRAAALGSDEEDDINNSNDSFRFSRLEIDKIISDLSFVVVSKLIFNDTLIGFRFRLKNGCLDISIDKGRELGIVPYKIGKRITLTQVNGIYVSNYECKNKVLFPDISGDDELCRELLQIALS